MSKNLSTDWGKVAVLLAAVIIYLVTFIGDPAEAKASIDYSLGEIRKLFVPLIVAIFVGSTVKNLVTPDLISKFFNGGRGILTAGALGGILPPCPFVSYPTIKGFDDGGVGLPGLMVMLVTTTTVEVGQLFCGIAVFGPAIVGLRILFAFASAMVVGLSFFFLYSYLVLRKSLIEDKVGLPGQ